MRLAYAVNLLRHKLPNIAVVDIRKAYDCVPRHLLQRLLEEKLPYELSTMIRKFLWTMRLKTKTQQ